MVPRGSTVRTLNITIVQTSASLDVESNLERIEELLSAAPDSDLIALPEVFALRGDDRDHREVAEPVPGSIIDRMAAIATARDSWLLAGSLVEASGEQACNTSLLLDRQGRVAATYRKIHLFEAHLDDGTVIREEDSYSAGTEPVVVELDGWCCGMSICYDLRFPELYRLYADRGANLFFVPANFTQNTGRDHWEVLLRARAIENQCFVIAPNQCGTNERTGVASYGNSMAVGPWGDVLCRAGDTETVLSVELDPESLHKVRNRIPVLDHRKLGASGSGAGIGTICVSPIRKA